MSRLNVCPCGIHWHGVLAVYKHDVTCVPISARLPSRHSRLCRQRNPEKTKSLELFWFLFCLRMLWIYLTCPSVRPSVRVLFCFCVIYVFSAASVAPERACLSDECEMRIRWLSGAESGVFLLSRSDFQEGCWGLRGRSEGWQREGQIYVESEGSR